MMDDEYFSTTLAYTKSPKTSRRTTFQDELKTAVSARANRQSYPDDFDDDDDDILNELLKMQKQKKVKFKAGKTKGKINDFNLSGDEEENGKPKKVYFMKTKRNSSPVNSEQLHLMKREDDRQSSVPSQSNSYSLHSDSPFSSLSDKFLPESALLQKDEQSKPVMQTRNQTESVVRKSLSDPLLPLNSENSQWESSPEPLPSEQDEDNQRIGEDGEPPVPQPRERGVKPKLSAGCPAPDMSPRPKPRQRTVKMCDIGQSEEESPAYSRTDTSSVSIALAPEKSRTSASDGVLGPDEDQSEKSEFCSPAEQMYPASVAASEESKERNYSTSFEEKHESLQGSLDHTSSTLTQISADRPSSSRSSSSRKHKSSYKAESKYLGALKILDQRTEASERLPEAADSLRAAVYQEWLKKKEETLKITTSAKKQEEKLKEEKVHKENRTKIADAKASYDAWKEKKSEGFRKKVKEKQEAIKQQQMELDKKHEQKETGKQQIFEKWKEEHDGIIKDRIRVKKQTERRQKLQQAKEKHEKKKDCISAFTEWSDRKKDVIEEKVKAEHRKEKIKEVEEEYEKEEKVKMALEMYDKWLKRKEFQQKRERKEKKIQAILQDDAPPPWSPPNKTIPFGK
ncbi:microtubule-associated protein 9-like isoform X3 [Carassius auratus]|uniref:Microtubule-associated protein 9-like isoform X3 n=1 Tax=Carassius auratus TaxID=7957 RepID=A0A6P6PZ83_CARAU|nr:microtubule-associated protein 9-like isoform X3 [Carassius auratus]